MIYWESNGDLSTTSFISGSGPQFAVWCSYNILSNMLPSRFLETLPPSAGKHWLIHIKKCRWYSGDCLSGLKNHLNFKQTFFPCTERVILSIFTTNKQNKAFTVWDSREEIVIKSLRGRIKDSILGPDIFTKLLVD